MSGLIGWLGTNMDRRKLPFTEEHKKKISLGLTGHKRTEEERIKVRERMLKTSVFLTDFNTRTKTKPFDQCSYAQKHDKLYRLYGRPYKCEAENCKGKSDYFEWANISGEYNTIDRSDWKMLCGSCHKKFDGIGDSLRKWRLEQSAKNN